MRVVAITLLLSVFLSLNLRAQTAGWGRTEFRKADSIATLYPGHSLDNLKGLADKLTRHLPTEKEKFRAIYKWVCDNIAFDYRLYLKIKDKRERSTGPAELSAWNKELSAQVFERLRKDRKTICTGYAYLLKQLAWHAGIASVIVDGYGRTSQANIRGTGAANHSWNAVKLNNKWYLCDPTWSSGVYDRSTGFIRMFNDAYFLTDPAQFIRDHYPLDESWTLLNNKPMLTEFLNAPFVYRAAFDYGLDLVSPQKIDITTEKGATVSFRFAKNDSKAIENAALRIERSGIINTAYHQVDQDPSGLCRIDHTFTTKGKHTVNVLLNDTYVLAYTVTVK